MSGFRQVLIGFLVIFIVGLIILGALTLSLTERGKSSAQPASPTQEVTPTSSHTAVQKPTTTPTITPIPSDDILLKETTETATEIAEATKLPESATPVQQIGASTATPPGIEGEEELPYRSIFPGVFMEVPNISSLVIIQEQVTEVSPTATEQAQIHKSKSCSLPRGWVAYTVRRGDTLARLSQRSGVSVAQIKNANCLRGSNKLKLGKTIFLPRVSYAPYFAPPMRFPMPPPPWYYRPSGHPQPVLPEKPIVVITMPPG